MTPVAPRPQVHGIGLGGMVSSFPPAPPTWISPQIDLFEKDSFLFVKRVLPFAFASCVRDFKSNLDFGKTTFRYMNKLPNLN